MDDFPRALLGLDISRSTITLLGAVASNDFMNPRTRDLLLNKWMVSNREMVSLNW